MTLDIATICEITTEKIARNSYKNPYCIEIDTYRFEYDICKDAPNWIGTEAQPYLEKMIREHNPTDDWEKRLNFNFDEIGKGKDKNYHWDLVGDPKYNQWTPTDGLDEHPYSHNHKWEYIHIIGSSDGAYGKQFHFHYGFATDYCRKTKSRKALQNFEIGKFYKVRMSNYTKNGRFSKYEYEIEEISEEEYKWESLLTYWDS